VREVTELRVVFEINVSFSNTKCKTLTRIHWDRRSGRKTVTERLSALREGSKSLEPTDRNKVNVLSCASRVILLLQSRAKVSAEERDCIEETIEIILAELEEI
jgi:hypothetical protein